MKMIYEHQIWKKKLKQKIFGLQDKVVWHNFILM